MTCSVIVFTLDEEVHLPGCLASLDWCDDVVVVDSFSSDDTEAICRKQGVGFYQNKFAGFGSQRNWALDNVPLKYDWILVLDADERVTPELAMELTQISSKDGAGHAAYRVRRRFYMWGQWLRYSSMYPTWVVRFLDRKRVRYRDRGHAETQEVQGSIGDLKQDLIDENLKGIDEWFERQNRYSRKESDYELSRPKIEARFFSSDPLQRRQAVKRLVSALPFRGVFYFFYSYIIRGGFRDGRNGLAFCRMRAMFYTMVELKRFDATRAGAARTSERMSKSE